MQWMFPIVMLLLCFLAAVMSQPVIQKCSQGINLHSLRKKTISDLSFWLPFKVLLVRLCSFYTECLSIDSIEFSCNGISMNTHDTFYTKRPGKYSSPLGRLNVFTTSISLSVGCSVFLLFVCPDQWTTFMGRMYVLHVNDTTKSFWA